MIKTFLNSCAEHGIIDRFEASDAKYLIRSGKSTYMLTTSKDGFLLTSNVEPDEALEVHSNNPEAVLSRVLATKLVGTVDCSFGGQTYSGVSVFPVRALKSAVEFSTAKGKKFLVNSSNTRVTLGLYDILYSVGGEHSILMMPELNDTDHVVKIASSFGVGLRSEYLHNQLISSVGPFVALPTEQKTRLSQNAFLYNRREAQGSSLSIQSAVSHSETVTICSNSKGYHLETKASIGGINYQFSGDAQIPLELVKSEAKLAGGDLYNVQGGMLLTSGAGSKLSEAGRSFTSTLALNSTCSFKKEEIEGPAANRIFSSWLGHEDTISKIVSVTIDY